MAINKNNIYFTSDTHFSHGNILKYSNRPFMNEQEQGVVNGYTEAFKPKGFVSTQVMADREKYEKAYKKLRISKETVERHDEALIENWNNKVPHNGVVYHLGDFCFQTERAIQILDRLNGQIFFIMGNHDKNVSNFKHKFGWVKDMYEIKVKDEEAPRGVQSIVLCHYAMRVWNKSHYGAWHCFGHSHHSLPDDPNALSMDVGVDGWNYTPLSYQEVKSFMKKKTWKPIDHHKGNS